jgi:hypothetical protein
MSDSPVPGPGTSREARPPARKIVRAVLRAAGSTTALVVIYYLLPLDRFSAGAAVTMLVIGLVAFIVLLTFQVRLILGARFPGLRAVEALATSLPLFLLLFASTYLVIATDSAGSFSQQLTHTDALYFTVTVFATVGFPSAVTANKAHTHAGQFMRRCPAHLSASGPLAVVTRSRARPVPLRWFVLKRWQA